MVNTVETVVNEGDVVELNVFAFVFCGQTRIVVLVGREVRASEARRGVRANSGVREDVEARSLGGVGHIVPEDLLLVLLITVMGRRHKAGKEAASGNGVVNGDVVALLVSVVRANSEASLLVN